MKKRITKDCIFETAFKLEKEGKNVSSTSIRNELGSGSLSTITKYLKEWISSKDIINDAFPDIKKVINTIEDDLLFEFFSNELPQVTALSFSFLTPKKAASTLKKFEDNKREEILEKMENIGFIQARVIGNIARILEEDLKSINLTKGENLNGKKHVELVKQELLDK
jgi:flagellar motor switch protein FliG